MAWLLQLHRYGKATEERQNRLIACIWYWFSIGSTRFTMSLLTCKPSTHTYEGSVAFPLESSCTRCTHSLYSAFCCSWSFPSSDCHLSSIIWKLKIQDMHSFFQSPKLLIITMWLVRWNTGTSKILRNVIFLSVQTYFADYYWLTSLKHLSKLLHDFKFRIYNSSLFGLFRGTRSELMQGKVWWKMHISQEKGSLGFFFFFNLASVYLPKLIAYHQFDNKDIEGEPKSIQFLFSHAFFFYRIFLFRHAWLYVQVMQQMSEWNWESWLSMTDYQIWHLLMVKAKM